MKAPERTQWRRLDAAHALPAEEAGVLSARLAFTNVRRVWKLVLLAGILELLVLALGVVLQARARAGQGGLHVPAEVLGAQLAISCTCLLCAAGLGRPAAPGKLTRRHQLSLAAAMPLILGLACWLSVVGATPDVGPYLIAVALVAASVYIRPGVALPLFAAALAAMVLARLLTPGGDPVAGVIGKRKFIYDLWGDAVNTASRMESHGVPGRIQVSEATYRLLAGEFLFEERGEVEVKGKGPMRAYFLEGRREDAP